MKRILLAASVSLALAVAAPGLAQYQTKAFPLPNQTYIHDVAPGPSGTVFWTAQQDGMLGILDPKTGKNEFVKLGPNSAPHGVITAKNGIAWIADGGQEAIVSYDPKTKAVKLYKLPGANGYTNLNTPTEDGDGNIWFTGQSGFHGRVDVKTGKVDLWKSPKGSGSYGMTTTPDGNVWFVSLASSYLGQVDRKTGNVKVIEPPVPNAGPRRVWSDSKGDLWISEWNAGQLAKYSPATGQWSRYPLPTQVRSHLYAVYVDSKDLVWVSNWGDDKIYSFDPKTQKFASFPGSKANAGVRQINGAPGVVMIPESGNATVMTINTGGSAS